MNDQSTTAPPTIRLSEAIFAVADVVATIKFYRQVLGFEGEWLWGNPLTFGGATWGSIQVMFNQQSKLAGKVEGHEHFFRCDDINSLYEKHKATGAPIVCDIENKPWGIREYTVRDPNGYHLRFSGPPIYQPPATACSTLSPFIRIAQRLPTVEEFRALLQAVAWNYSIDTLPTALAHSVMGVVAIDTRQDERVVGMVRVIGDGVRAVSIQDVAIIPELQGQRIGSAMMETVMASLKKTLPPGAFVILSTPKPAFYKRFGFNEGGGMYLQM